LKTEDVSAESQPGGNSHVTKIWRTSP
jgi:hypothetical protein